GQAVLKYLCRVAIEPDTCVTMSKERFRKYGLAVLIVSKFVPGLGTVSTPMAGLMRVHAVKFVGLDAAGAALWSGVYLGIGFLFRHQLEVAAERAMQFGFWCGVAAILVLAAYIGFKYYQRRRVIRDLQIARVTPEEVKRMLDAGEEITVVDLRTSI